MLSAFSIGKPTSVVIDLGASGTQISAVHDGYELKKSKLQTLRGGDWIDQQLQHVILKGGVRIKPPFDSNGENILVAKSYRDMVVMDTVKDIKRWMSVVPPKGTPSSRQEYISNLQIPPYYLPDGTKVSYSEEVCTIPELLFSHPNEHRIVTNVQQYLNLDKNYRISLPKLVHECLSRCDIDVRKDLTSSVLVAGGGSLIEGISSRLAEELNDALPAAYKPKMASPMAVERHYAAWIGGSILGICGSFQQMWLSKQEFEDQGDRVVLQKFVDRA